MNLEPNKHVFAYWQGDVPPIVAMCLQTLQAHNSTFVLLNADSIDDLGGQHILDATQGKGTAHRSDIVRTWALHQFGGTWVDADLICLNPFDLNERLQAESQLVQVLGFGMSHRDNHFSNIVFAARQGSSILAERVEQQLDILRKLKTLKYAQIGRPIPDNVKPVTDVRVTRLERKKILPINAGNSYLYMQRGQDTEHARRPHWDISAYSYHVWSRISKRFAGKTQEQVLASNTFLGFVLRQALGRISSLERVCYGG